MLLRVRGMLHFVAAHMSVLLVVGNASQPFGSDCQAHGHRDYCICFAKLIRTKLPEKQLHSSRQSRGSVPTSGRLTSHSDNGRAQKSDDKAERRTQTELEAVPGPLLDGSLGSDVELRAPGRRFGNLPA